MRFHSKEVQLKNNRTVTIREARPSDAKRLLDTIKTYIAGSDYIPKFPEEITLTVKQEREWIGSFLESENSILLIAEYESHIIGNIDLTGNRRKIMQHTGVIGMGMLKEWRNAGLGAALLRAVIDWAKKNSILELVWLQVYTANIPGVSLYSRPSKSHFWAGRCYKQI